MTIYIYKKTHVITGLKYLGKTSSKNPYKYKGSGKYWKSHIKKHGNNVTTDVLKECKTKLEAKIWGIYYSNLWDVVKSNEWANLIPETADGADTSFKHWNNGIDQIFCPVPPNDTFVRGRLDFNNKGAQIGADVNKQKHWINNDIDEKMIYKIEPIPIGWTLGRTISKKLKGKNKHAKDTVWWNNGILTKMSKFCPGPQWIRGRELGVNNDPKLKTKSAMYDTNGKRILSESTKNNIRKSKIGKILWNNGNIMKMSESKPGANWIRGRIKSR